MPDLPVSPLESAAATRYEDRLLHIISGGRADIAAGRILTPQRIDDWIETIGTAYETPVPQSMLISC